MSDDEYPHFGGAWTATSSAAPAAPASASWNPAFRPDSHRGHVRSISTASNDDFFDRYPAPTPEKPRARAQDTLEEQDEPESPYLHPSVSEGNSTKHEEESSYAEDVVPHVPTVELDASHQELTEDEDAKIVHKEADQTDKEALIFQSDEAAQDQKGGFKHSLSLPPREPMYIGSPGLLTPMPQEQIEDGQDIQSLPDSDSPPNLDYEHQGEALDMEEAVDEAPDAPLLMDPEEPPIVEELKREPTLRAVSEGSMLELDGAPAPTQPLPKARPQLGHVDRSFTTDFTELQTPTESDRVDDQDRKQTISSGWPEAGDDKTFAEILGDEPTLSARTKEPAADLLDEELAEDDGWGGATNDDTFGELLGHEDKRQAVPVQEPGRAIITETPAEGTGDQDADLAAMWQAALDDDDLLDDGDDLDPSAIFGDDDPGFLEDELSAPLPPAVQQTSQRQRTTSAYMPASVQQPVQPPALANQYITSTPQPLSQSHGRSAETPSTGLYDIYGHKSVPQQQKPPRPSAQTAQSFVDKAKGGYQSPYDLPMDVVKQPRQRQRQVQSGPQAVPTPPPRSSSMSSQTGAPQLRPSTGASMSPPSSVGSVSAAPPPTTANGALSAKATPKTDNGFFADLPIAPKPRTRLSGAYTPQPQTAPTPPPSQMPQQHPSRAAMAQTARSVQHPSAPPTQPQPAIYGGLSKPEKLPLLPDQPTAPQQVQPRPPQAAGPSQNQRYSPNSLPAPAQPQKRFSPAPPSQASTATSRYSPAPSSQPGQAKKYSVSGPASTSTPPGIQHAHAFAPRTSSPLAFQTDKPQPALPNEALRQMSYTPNSPPKANSVRSAGTISPEQTINTSYFPSERRTSAAMISPPQRPLSQSPPAVMKVPRYSAQAVEKIIPSTASVSESQRTNYLAHRRHLSRELDFTAPNDERAQDPLERWKGHPVFKWGESGVVLSSFPKQTPFYAVGHGIPSVKCTPGAISVQQATSFMPMDDHNSKFPGPLAARAKGRKKEVAAWMTTKIDDLERRNELVKMDFQMDVDLRKRTEEKLLLWRIAKILVEHDGKLEGDKKIEAEVRAVLLPNLAQMNQVMDLQSPVSGAAGLQTEGVDKAIIFQLRQALLEGERERAVWLAEEKRLWGHAMLIASTMGPETWKQIIQSFVRSQVKAVGSDARSLAALYQVFAGNSEECVDELVPPSARAGFHMVSKADGTISGNPLDGLDQWRETLGLVAGNRTQSDQQSLLALGKLLSSYGRAEAAHTCFLFARQLTKHTGADDAEASFVILGANHQSQSDSFANDLDAIILTEIYEWAVSLSAPSSAVHYIPHLQSYKLIHAQELAAYGLKSKAQSYCDHITSAYTSTTRPSPYYHPTFTQAVNDLSAFLSQTPQNGSSGLLSKGAMNKVSSGAASWFTKFVSGDDDQESTGSRSGAPGEDANGPFGRVSGDSPDISRSASGTDLYNPMMGGVASLGTSPQQFAPSSAPSKYSPMVGANKYAPMSTGNLISSAQRQASPQRPASASARNYAPAASIQPLGVPRPDTGRAVSDYNIPYGSDSRRGSAQYPGSQGIYEPRPSLSEERPATYGYQPYISEQAQAPPTGEPQLLDVKPNGIDSHHETLPDSEDGGFQASSTGGYEPPTGGYEPPSYQPYEPEPEPEPENEDLASKPKKKSFMDDDDNDEFSKPPPAMQKSEADRQADEAFRKAAEADAARDKANGAADRKSWFGGWFGKKDPNAPQAGPIRAKLGEENSFYYDENLKKWVNKKGGAEAATPAAATPPPPRGPASRAVSATMGPPSGTPSRVASASALAGPPGARPPVGSAMGSPSMGPPSGPPSRIGTPASGDVPLVPAGVAALNGSEGRPPSAPPSRPTTSMSNASSLDDLLGGPPGPGQRKAGGTVRSKKKGARYVDVMQSG